MRHLCLLIFSAFSIAFCLGLEHQKAELNDRGISELSSEVHSNGIFIYEIADLKFDPGFDAIAYSGYKSGEELGFQHLHSESQRAKVYTDGNNHPVISAENRDQHFLTKMYKKPILKITKYQLL